MFLFKDTMQWRRRGPNPRPSVSSQTLLHGDTALPMDLFISCKLLTGLTLGGPAKSENVIYLNRFAEYGPSYLPT